MQLVQLFQVLWARRKLLLLVLASVFLAMLALSMLMSKTYVAEVSLVADFKGIDPVSGMQLPSQTSLGYLATQIDVIKSRNAALKVVDRMQLAHDETMQGQFQDATGGRGSINDWLAGRLLRGVDVVLSRESNVINIRFSSSNPELAAKLANAFADAYIATSLELKLDPARRQAGWFEEQIGGLRVTLEATQQRLSQYQQKYAIVGTDDRLDVENSRLTDLGNQLVVAQSAMYDAQTRQKQLDQALQNNQIEQVPDILSNQLLQAMKADLTRAEGKFADVAERYGQKHPQYISSAAEVQTLKAKLNTELNTVKGAINQTAQIAKQRTSELQRAVEEQKARILKIKKQRDGRDVLNREVESAQRAYDAALQRANQVRLESQLDQSNLAVLNPAIAPSAPARPKLLLNLVLGIVLGSMLGAGVALSAEMIDRRVRGAGDLTGISGITVLGELPKAPCKRAAAKRSHGSDPSPAHDSESFPGQALHPV